MHSSLNIEISIEGTRCCRACLSVAKGTRQGDYVDMREALMETSSGGKLNLLNCFNKCTQLSLSEEELSDYGDNRICRYLCIQCRHELEQAYNFIRKAQLNNKVLHSQLVQLKCEASETCNEQQWCDIAVTDKEPLFVKEPKSANEKDEYECDKINAVSEENKDKLKRELDEIFSINMDKEVLTYKYIDSLPENSCDSMNSKENIDTLISVERVYANLHESGEFSLNAEVDSAVMLKVEHSDTEVEDYVEGIADIEEECKHVFTFKCEFCTSEFGLERNLVQHYEKDHGDRNLHFACELCNKRFVNKKTLHLHSRQIHQQCEYVDCSECGRIVLKSFYKVHLKRHTKQKKFLCSQCPNTFISRSTLQKHMQKHSDKRDRNYECLNCGRKFFTADTLQRHQATHQDPFKRTCFECTICAKSFMLKANLRLHMQTHRGETIGCSHCGKQFVRRKDLEIHIRFHTGDFPYTCSFCDKRFAIKGHLTYHEKRHSGVRYKCNQCEKVFINLSGLREHSFEHTGMPLVCKICLRGFPTQYKMRRHLRGLHCQLFEESGYSDALASQYIITNESAKLEMKRIPAESLEMIEMLEEYEDDIPKELLKQV